MDLAAERNEGVLTIRACERIDGAVAAAFHEAVRAAIAEDDRAVLIDCEDLTFISSAGLRVILLTAKMLSGRNAGFALCSMSAPIRNVFEISGFATIIAIHPTGAEALASFEGP